MTDQSPKKDIYSTITNKIIADLEKGELTWRKPWRADHLSQNVMRPLRWNNIPYSGINTIMLWATAAEQGYQSVHWMTYDQAIELGGHVRKTEKSKVKVVYADKKLIEEQKESGETENRYIPFLKSWPVFNASQIDGLPEKFMKAPEPIVTNTEQRNQELETFFAQTKATIQTGNRACYYPTLDKIEMPPFEAFYDAKSYYSVLSHELTHWTKHPTRLSRDLGSKSKGDEGYAKEELVAELGSCFLAADLGLKPETREEHAAYIQSWLSALKNDKRLIFSAASQAQKAVEYIHGLQTNSSFINGSEKISEPAIG